MGFLAGYAVASMLGDSSEKIIRKVLIGKIIKIKSSEKGFWAFKYPVKYLDVKSFKEDGNTKIYNLFTSEKKLFNLIEECNKKKSLIVIKFDVDHDEIINFSKIKKESLVDILS